MEDQQAFPLPTRRTILRNLGAAGIVGIAAGHTHLAEASSPEKTSSRFFPLLRQPDTATAFAEELSPISLDRSGSSWTGRDISLVCGQKETSLELTLTAPTTPMVRLHLRWNSPVPADVKLLADAWERSYGDMGWMPIVPERALPWYFLIFDGKTTHGYGVKTGAGALAFWQCDREGVSLWLDVRNGGKGVLLGQRQIALATVVARLGHADESPFAAAQAFCRILSPTPRLSKEPVYGSNDWYYAYGDSSAQDILRDADLVAELAPASGPRPFVVTDEGWEHSPKFPSMPGLAAEIVRKGVRPGIWVRPLRARGEKDASLLLPASRFKDHSTDLAYDPTIPEARRKTLETIRLAAEWKYELVKHDFSTYDLLGQWGNDMGASPTVHGWSFHDRSQTNAEIIRDLYEDIRKVAGDQTILVGCNVVGHLSAGIFELQRTGDDVSGKAWERTRRMGVNTLAFRLPQHTTFFAMDPDCIPITEAIPWTLTERWLDAVAAAGASVVISPRAGTMGAPQKEAVRRAFAIAAKAGTGATPIDWLNSRTPEEWTQPKGAGSASARYEWLEAGGASPFPA
ncbi:Alpha-galactosidase-like protein [Acidisarcina polymorpha]|uniref:Alpha-galactosidase-like protein n=1 Tax=Acidisarcina polymorpha TaxID=2211140 RepID=A0A2Z5FYV0_9BACT|nr:hypothetical protein [Acidisarcina polymorpha]AXC12031.1 Alpha-galactosidase-like protein [Acidisarcina polymorpha]